MKSFIAACVAAIVIGVGAWMVLDTYQRPSTDAYATSGVRL